MDERIDAARRRNDDLRALDAKLFAVTEKCVGIELRNLHDGLVLAARALEHLVFAGVGIGSQMSHVGDIHYPLERWPTSVMFMARVTS